MDRVLALLRTLPTFSGLAVVLALFLSLPWLSRASQQRPASAAAAQPIVRSASTPFALPPLLVGVQVPPQDDMEELYVIHLVATEADVAPLHAVYPDDRYNIIVVVPLEQRNAFAGLRGNVAAGMPSGILLRDHRCTPPPPSPQLCPAP